MNLVVVFGVTACLVNDCNCWIVEWNVSGAVLTLQPNCIEHEICFHLKD